MQLRSAVSAMLASMAAGLTPPEPIAPSAWAAQNLVVPDGPRAGDLMDMELTAYLKEPLDCLGPDSPVNEIAVRKSAQTGFTTLLIAAVGHSIDRDPCRMMLVQPTADALADFNREKLQPAIESSKTLAGLVAGQISHSARGSTAYAKQFPGGSLTLTIATSAADLRSKTVRKLFRDEIDQYPDDLDGQGDPLDISNGRLMSFLASGNWRKADISTPTIKGASRIQERFEAGDQRYLFVRCPGCGDPLRFEWGAQFRYDRSFPHRAHYVAPCCGSVIEAHQKNELVREAVALKDRGEPFGWQPTAERPGAFPSYHFDTLSSPFVPWDEVAKAWLDAEGKERKEKAFWNLWLGLPFEVKGDAPDHVRLMERREDYPADVVPPLGLLLTAGADVQHSGIWLEVVAFAPDRQTWTVTQRFLEGDTTDPDRGAFAKLREVYDERFLDSYGNRRPIDAIAIDAGDGGRANQVYAFARGRHRAYAIKGMQGWNRPALGTPTKVSISLSGKKLKGSGQLWPVGTWDLKAEFYANLRKEGRRAGQEIDPPGYCHFGAWLDEGFFRQITSEYLADVKVAHRMVKRWQTSGPNHLLDCRVYAMAMAEHLGLTRKSREQWLELARRYSVPTQSADLFAPEALAVERVELPGDVDVAAQLASAIQAKESRPPRRRARRFARLGRH